MSKRTWFVSRDWLLYLDDLIASAQKIGRLTEKRSLPEFVQDEAAFDAVLFNLQIIGESIKRLPETRRMQLPPEHRAGPARLRDLIAHHYFSLDAEIIWEVATHHVPGLLGHALALRSEAEGKAAG
jgi:uncharacterized protein with HEPN domain